MGADGRQGPSDLLSVLNHLMIAGIARTPEYLRELTTLSKRLPALKVGPRMTRSEG